MNSFILIFTGVIAALLTNIVSIYLAQGAVRSSAFLSVLVCLFFYVYPALLSPYLTKNIPVVFFGASFIGMASREILASRILISAAGCTFSLIYLNTDNLFNNFGGRLGLSAFISVLVAHCLDISFMRKNEQIVKP